MIRHQEATPILATNNPFSSPTSEEALVTDTRAGLSPAQMVERKLVSLLKRNALPVGHVQMRLGSLNRGRGQ
jgi:hypothetical protein